MAEKTPSAPPAAAPPAAATGSAETEPSSSRIESELVAATGLELGILVMLGVVWLVATLRLADDLLFRNRLDAGQLASGVSLVLPGVVNASLLAGASIGLAASLLRLADSGQSGRAAIIRRALVGSGAAAILGALTVLLILLRYGAGSATVVLAITVGFAAVLGGAAAGLPRPILVAAAIGTLEVFVLGVLAGYFQSPLKSVLGAGTDPASQLSAASWLQAVTAITQGVAIGLTTYFYLRQRTESRSWPRFALAGALPGVMLLVGLALSVIGGSGLSNLSGELSDADRIVRDLVNGAGLNQALTVAFVGAIVAMIMVGRTLRRSPEDDEPA